MKFHLRAWLMISDFVKKKALHMLQQPFILPKRLLLDNVKVTLAV